jgi:hypothetical protein
MGRLHPHYATVVIFASLLHQPRSAVAQQHVCDFSVFGIQVAEVNLACAANGGGLPTTCTAACAAKYLPFYASCGVFIKRTLQSSQTQQFEHLFTECKKGTSGGSDTGACTARLDNLEARLSSMPVSFWQGDGTVFVGRNSSAQFAPCTPVFLYDAGLMDDQGPMDCMNGLRGVSDIQLAANHEYPITPVNGCPPNPISGPGGGWTERKPSNGKHYFANVLSGDTGGFNSWGVDDDTSDGGQFQVWLKLPPHLCCSAGMAYI